MAWSLNEVPLFDPKISRVDQLDHIFAYKTLSEWPKKIYEKVSLGGEGVTKLCQTSLGYFKTFNISPVKKYQDKYSAMQNILPWQIYIPDKYSLLKYINP